MTLIDVQAALVMVRSREDELRRELEIRRLVPERPAGSRPETTDSTASPANRVWLAAFVFDGRG